ncbi:MAG TPA: 50S ribosomal protein L9 [Candidatus Azoamicus sp.]
MKIILLEKINNIGNVGDVINIKNGYAKNYILPNKKGFIATTKNIDKIKNNLKLDLNNENKQEIKNNKALNNINIFVSVSVKKNDDLYGSFNITRLSKIIKKLNIKLNVKHIDSEFNVKKIGNYNIAFKNKKTNLTTDIHLNLLKAK